MEFQAVLEEDPETRSFTATVPVLPEIVVDPKSEREALDLVREAIQFTLNERAKGQRAPPPSGIHAREF